ncbi:MAG TPA: hypothetical protein VKV04_20805 [Verrucomicrobiae bacterium]|nr:hypothetical protein [Verrucomicrobiae bacterium]
MNKKSWFLVLVAVALCACYVIFFTNWFKSKNILIADNERFGRVVFTLGQPYELTSLKVVSVGALSSNKYALPVWELKSDNRSAPIKLFSYGQHIQGMKPAVENTRPIPLDHGTAYRLFIEAAGIKAQHDFTP